MILQNKNVKLNEVGGKAYNLISLNIKNTPKLYVVPTTYFNSVKNNPILKEELEKELALVFSEKVKYAVRSSAIDEDSDKASFAGIHESYLNIKKADLFYYINQVYASAFSDKAIEYRKVKGLPLDNIEIAVIIQEMVDAEYAGVINTINPITNNPDEIVISVTTGLGEKLVDGTVDGTNYYITGKDVKVIGKDILSKKQIDNILVMVREIVTKAKAFQDIEFAVIKDKVYFLQTRDIITYQGINPHKRSLLIDNSNIIESYFGVTSPFTYSFAKQVYHDVYSATLRLGKVRESLIKKLEPSLKEMLFYHEGKIYYNMQSWYHVTSIFPFKKSTSYMENMMGVKSKTNDFVRVKMNLVDIIKLAYQFINKLVHIDKISDEFEENFNRIVLPYYNRPINGTNEELRNLFLNIEKEIIKEFAIPIVNDCAVMIYFGMLKDKAKKLNISPEELNQYINNQGDVKSAGSAKDLIEIVKIIKDDEELLRDFRTLNNQDLINKYHDNSRISKLLNDYIFLYGPRVMDELKIETITMIEDKNILYDLIKENLDISHKEVVYKEVMVPKKISKLVEKTKKYIKNRERLRLKRTYVYSVVRNIILGFGRNYYNLGQIAKVEDIFYLTKEEILFGKGNFKELIELRKQQEKAYLTKPVYNRVVFYNDKVLNVNTVSSSSGLKGIPSGNGIVTARVSLMNSPKDKLEKGNIILTKRTDPGWISLFPLASGLIVEHGSMLSHSFVVARELNLPAVVGLPNATKLIRDNQLVTLDGVKGEVILED